MLEPEKTTGPFVDLLKPCRPVTSIHHHRRRYVDRTHKHNGQMCCFYKVGAFITCRQVSHFNVLGKVIVLSCIVVGAVSCMDILNKAFRVLNLLPLLIMYSVLLTEVKLPPPTRGHRHVC